METIKARLKGISPIIMHNNAMANPMSVYAKAIKAVSSKRGKTDAEFETLARLEWEASLYMKGGVVVLPGENLHRALNEGARKRKLGKAVNSGAFVADDYPELFYSGPKIQVSKTDQFPSDELDVFYPAHSFTTLVRVQKNTTPRTRPIFHDWEVSLSIDYDEDVLDRESIIESFEIAGRMIGLGDWRPRYGRFIVEEV